jgi:hypothetical protein
MFDFLLSTANSQKISLGEGFLSALVFGNANFFSYLHLVFLNLN